MPIKLLHEGEGHVVTVELKNGETYRGMLTEAEDSMNCQMKEGTPLTFFIGNTTQKFTDSNICDHLLTDFT